VLRFLKIITPVKCVLPSYGGIIAQPEEGELYRRSTKKTIVELDQLVWSVNIDKPKSRYIQGLGLLWDATDILL
jgi:hypothetical protein